MDRFLVIDGSNLLFQMFFGMPARIVNGQGKAIQGTFGFVGAMLKIIRMVSPTHVTVVFDGEHENKRKELNPEYKGNRIDYGMVPEEENPFSQLPDVYKALDYLKMKYTETIDTEADDLIAGYALSLGGKTEVVIASFDSDFFQLITDKVSVLRYRGEKTVICTPAYVKERFGVIPGQYADFKSLVGDRADNIKGAEKVGAKTAASLLNEFGSLENILAGAEKIRWPSVRESIIRNTDRLKKNRQLIKLEACEALPFEEEELAYFYDGIKTKEVIKGIE
ncbi:5'-3' exonuclease [Parablautia muri]|uniref:5'-3' exonuclease n=1 Tax=Parablautia muri TaxID=2320879 RepID=A0A9X5GU15_9FIRM|nr:5'-3' exonuclease [Parablautia muri]